MQQANIVTYFCCPCDPKPKPGCDNYALQSLDKPHEGCNCELATKSRYSSETVQNSAKVTVEHE